jgi:hypothetical protein
MEDIMMDIAGRITKKPDGSYLIDQGYGPDTYHAHAEATPEQYKAAEEYARAHPDLVDDYKEPEPPPRDEKAERTTEILTRLSQIDREAIRPMRAALSGTSTLYDTDKLAELEQEADKLRAELSTLGEP